MNTGRKMFIWQQRTSWHSTRVSNFCLFIIGMSSNLHLQHASSVYCVKGHLFKLKTPMCLIGMEGSVFGGKATVITGFLLFKYSKTSLIEYSRVSVDYKIKNIYKWFFSYIFKVEEKKNQNLQNTRLQSFELHTIRFFLIFFFFFF